MGILLSFVKLNRSKIASSQQIYKLLWLGRSFKLFFITKEHGAWSMEPGEKGSRQEQWQFEFKIKDTSKKKQVAGAVGNQ
jgi:hypothetical protein